jgi:flagellar P-ring protein precursor FlgI
MMMSPLKTKKDVVRRRHTRSAIFVFLFICSFVQFHLIAATRIKDLVDIKGLNDQQLIGYSLVVGLDGTGDSRRAAMTVQAVQNMMVKFGINVPNNNFSLQNVASVMVTASVSPFAKEGSEVDVVVSSLGDAKSLEGGTLLMTPLIGKDNQVYGRAQGPVSIGGFNIETVSGEKYRKNFALVGRVPQGAVIERPLPNNFSGDSNIELLLREPDFTSAVRIAERINTELGNSMAKANDAGSVLVELPNPDAYVTTIARMELLEVDADQEARVVINERTGTVVVGQHVQLLPAAVAHGNLTIRVNSVPYVSQPPALSGGTTVVVPQTATEVQEDTGGNVAVFQNMANVEDLASMLNGLNVSARDIIAIFQALKSAGALQAKLVIM